MDGRQPAEGNSDTKSAEPTPRTPSFNLNLFSLGKKIGDGRYVETSELISTRNASQKKYVLKTEKKQNRQYSQSHVLKNAATVAKDLLGEAYFIPGSLNDPSLLIEPLVEGERLSEFKIASVSEFLNITVQIAEQLAAMHKKNYVHGDFSRNNVLVKRIGQKLEVKVIDFGATRKRGELTLDQRTPADFYQDNLRFLNDMLDLYQQLHLKGHAIAPTLGSILYKKDLPDEVIVISLQCLEAVNYFIENQHMIFADFLFQHFERLHYLKMIFSDTVNLTNFISFLDKKYHHRFLELIAADGFLQQILKPNDHIIQLYHTSSEEAGVFILNVILNINNEDERKQMILNLNEQILRFPNKLIFILEQLSLNSAQCLFSNLQFQDEQLMEFAQLVFQKFNSDLDKTIHFFNNYCKNNVILYQSLLKLFNQFVYRPHFENQKVSCWSAFFYQSVHQRNRQCLARLNYLKSPEDFKAVLVDIENPKLKLLSNQLLEASIAVARLKK